MSTPEQALADFRARIDAIDEQLAKLFIERIGIVHEVGNLKRAHWPNSCHIRPAREGQMHRWAEERFASTGFPPLAALTMWRQLIGASTHVESPLSVSYNVDFPEHLWLAREYFGLQIGLHAAATLDESIAQMQDGKSNILLLPADVTAPCWPLAKTLVDAGLMIFAAIPAATQTLPTGMMPALALAPVTPEPSGNDMSYFLRNGKVEIVDGFVPSHDDSLFLGAHPRAITL
jgi:chorismate mutase